jgi:versiconal hemiacetal acetate esterase
MGGSAGGILSLGLARRAIRDPAYKSSLKGVVALCPATVHPKHVPSEYKSLYDQYYPETATTAPVIDAESVRSGFDNYSGVDPEDSSHYALLAKEDHASFPPTYILSCEFDPLRADSYTLKEALADAGVKVKHDEFLGLPHFFWIFPMLLETQNSGPKVLAGIEWLKSHS